MLEYRNKQDTFVGAKVLMLSACMDRARVWPPRIEIAFWIVVFYLEK